MSQNSVNLRKNTISLDTRDLTQLKILNSQEESCHFVAIPKEIHQSQNSIGVRQGQKFEKTLQKAESPTTTHFVTTECGSGYVRIYLAEAKNKETEIMSISEIIYPTARTETSWTKEQGKEPSSEINEIKTNSLPQINTTSDTSLLYKPSTIRVKPRYRSRVIAKKKRNKNRKNKSVTSKQKADCLNQKSAIQNDACHPKFLENTSTGETKEFVSKFGENVDVCQTESIENQTTSLESYFKIEKSQAIHESFLNQITTTTLISEIKAIEAELIVNPQQSSTSKDVKNSSRVPVKKISDTKKKSRKKNKFANVKAKIDCWKSSASSASGKITKTKKGKKNQTTKTKKGISKTKLDDKKGQYSNVRLEMDRWNQNMSFVENYLKQQEELNNNVEYKRQKDISEEALRDFQKKIGSSEDVSMDSDPISKKITSFNPISLKQVVENSLCLDPKLRTSSAVPKTKRCQSSTNDHHLSSTNEAKKMLQMKKEFSEKKSATTRRKNNHSARKISSKKNSIKTPEETKYISKYDQSKNPEQNHIDKKNQFANIRSKIDCWMDKTATDSDDIGQPENAESIKVEIAKGPSASSNLHYKTRELNRDFQELSDRIVKPSSAATRRLKALLAKRSQSPISKEISDHSKLTNKKILSTRKKTPYTNKYANIPPKVDCWKQNILPTNRHKPNSTKNASKHEKLKKLTNLGINDEAKLISRFTTTTSRKQNFMYSLNQTKNEVKYPDVAEKKQIPLCKRHSSCSNAIASNELSSKIQQSEPNDRILNSTLESDKKHDKATQTDLTFVKCKCQHDPEAYSTSSIDNYVSLVPNNGRTWFSNLFKRPSKIPITKQNLENEPKDIDPHDSPSSTSLPNGLKNYFYNRFCFLPEAGEHPNFYYIKLPNTEKSSSNQSTYQLNDNDTITSSQNSIDFTEEIFNRASKHIMSL